MTWEELLTGAIIDTWIIVQWWSWFVENTDIWFSLWNTSLLSGVWWLFKWLFLAIRPFIKWLLIWLVILLVLYISVLFLFSYLTKRKRKKVKSDIPEDYKRYKEIGKQIIVNNMYYYGDVYDPEMEKEIQEEKENQKKEDLNKVNELKKDLSSNDQVNENKKVVL